MDKQYIRNIKFFLASMGKLDNSFTSFSRMYSMTTENIYGFLKNIDLKNKKVLTVAGSGDQKLNAYMLGAKEVTVFDINPLAFLQGDLKDAAVKNLYFNEFLSFFGISDISIKPVYYQLDARLFSKLADTLNPESNDFFKYIISNKDNISVEDIYFKFDKSLSLLSQMNGYLNEDSYGKLKNILLEKKTSCIESNVNNLDNELGNEKYDVILLSNISDYINRMYDIMPLYSFRDVIDSLIEHLNPGGIIQVGYIYYSKHRYISDFNIDRKRHLFFPTKEFHTMLVDSFDDTTQKDKIIIYQK